MKRFLFINGYGSQNISEDEKTLDNWFPYMVKNALPNIKIDELPIKSEPTYDTRLIRKVKWNEYDLAIGFSMGGLYICAFSPIKSLVINPAYGLSDMDSRFKYIESVENPNPNIYAIFGKNDKYTQLKPNYIKMHGTKNIIGEYDGKHVPHKEDLPKILPHIIELLK